METYFHGILRMDWGLGNPNKTAALIATLMVAVWWLACVRRWGFWAALTLFTGLGVCLIRTFSRGGLVALAVGLLPIFWKSARPWSRVKIAAVAISIGVMIGASVLWKAHERLGQGVTEEDKSITNRLEIWMKAPRMMVDAPNGWGLGNSGKAYMQWYQPAGRDEDYRTLVNSHLTWLVEFGWPVRLLYVGGWAALLGLLWPTEKRAWFAVPLGVWLCFGTAAWFSSVAESRWIWIVPSLSGVAALLYRLGDRAWPRLRAWLVVGGMAVAAVVLLFVTGSFPADCAIRGSAKRVIVGRGTPEMWVVIDGKTMGPLYGKTIRGALATSPARAAVGVVQNINDLPAGSSGTLVLGGAPSAADLAALKPALPGWRRVILVNPGFQPEELGLTENEKKVEVLVGEFNQSPALSAWSSFTPRIIEGAGDYLANWADLVLRE